MPGLLLGLLLMVQTSDTLDKNIPVLNDRLETILTTYVGDGIEGIELATLSNWKFKSGDDMGWADPSYDDSDWTSISAPSVAFDSLFTGIGWFRLTVYVDSSWTQEERAIRLNTYGASELYVDGEKIARLGVPSTDPQKEKVIVPRKYHISTYQNPVEFSPGKTMVIAIRYSLHDYPLYQRTEPSFLGELQLSVHILTMNNIVEILSLGQIDILIHTISSVLLFMVMFLHLAMYIRFPEEKGNFWIMVISGLILILASELLLVEFGLSQSRFIYHMFDWIFAILIVFVPLCLIPLCMGRLLKVEVRALWKYFPFVPVFIELINTLFYIQFAGWLGMTLILFVIIVPLIGAIEILWKARKLKRPSVWLIAGALISYPLILLLGLLLFVVFEVDNFVFNAVLNLLIFITIPLGFSVYQMVRFFNAHGNLEEEVKERTSELEQAYSDLQESLKELQATQGQLIQQEKLASLGQLTAGIAHEIKNPLNFVNNFSDLSVELVEEAREEVKEINSKFKIKNLGLIPILNDIETNLKKIHEHGTRADSIVKSMLEHSRGGSGKMEPTDLNVLVKEFVNLTFHGMRAGKNPINVDMEFDLDESIGEVQLIAEDFSRVIVNLCKNGFDAMREKLSAVSSQPSASYKAKLTVRTKAKNGKVVVEIEDDGSGIPEEMKDKILQPFFTTKKGTEGTGLGLSITNDIVKAHGGNMDIDSQPGRTVFTVKLNG